MSLPRDMRDDLEPGVPEELVRLAERFEHARPLPSAAFRGDLRRHLLRGPLPHSRPARLRRLIGGYAGAGSLLLLIGSASVSGLGPLGS